MKNENRQLRQDNKLITMPISVTTYERILKLENKEAALLLYMEYCSIALWQDDIQIWATTGFMCKRIPMTERKLTKAKKSLIELGLIQEIRKRNAENTGFGKTYIKVNFVANKGEGRTPAFCTEYEGTEYESQYKCVITKNNANTSTKNNSVNFKSIIAQNDEILNNNDMKITPKTTNEIILLEEIERLKKQNAQLSSKLEEFQPKQLSLFKPDELIQPKHFETFYRLYPRKAAKGKALLAWGNLCNQKSKANTRPTWKSVRKALILQKKTELWMTRPELIPYPASWINSNGWLNEPSEMIVFKQTTKELPKKAFGFVGKPLKYSESIKM